MIFSECMREGRAGKTHEMRQKVPGRQYCESSSRGRLDSGSGGVSRNSKVCRTSNKSMVVSVQDSSKGG